MGAASATWWLFAPFETVDDKTDEISYRFPIVNARKLSLSLFLSFSPLFLPSTSFFFSHHCTESSLEIANARRSTSSLSDVKEKKKYRARLFYTLHDFEAIFLFSLRDSSSSPLYLLRFQCVGYLSGSYLRGGSGLTRDDGRHIIRPSKNISTDEKSIRFLGCPITETAEIITNGTVDILNNFTLDIEQSYPPVLFCRTMFPAIFHAGN